MKKFGKFLFGALSLAAIAGGAFYFFKNVINKNSDDFEDFEDEFEDDDDEAKDDIIEKDDRGYVTLNISPDDVSDDTEDTASDDINVSEDEAVETKETTTP